LRLVKPQEVCRVMALFAASGLVQIIGGKPAFGILTNGWIDPSISFQ
jgi:hypothetical protein